jgi:hypothetical protein
MAKRIVENVMMVAFLFLVVLGMFIFHVSTGNVVFGIGEEEPEIIIEDFKIDNSDEVNEEVDLNGTQNNSGPE